MQRRVGGCRYVVVLFWLASILRGGFGPAQAQEPVTTLTAPQAPSAAPHGLWAGRWTYFRPTNWTPSLVTKIEQPALPSVGENTRLPPVSQQPVSTSAVTPSPLNEPVQTLTPTPSAPCAECYDPLWCHRCGVFADLLYLRPGNIDYIYAVEQTGTLPTDSPTGPTGRVGFDAALGYRLGVTQAISDCSSLQVTYLWFQDDTQDTITATPGNVLIFQPGVPAVPNVGSSSIQATANYDIRFQQVDLDYRALLYGTYDSAVNYFAGLRYANLKQDFHAQEDIGAPVGLRTVNSNISFDGFGIGFGLDGMRRMPGTGLLIYGRGSTSFVSGEFKANYRETSQFATAGVIGNTLADFRVLTILQAEFGGGWQSASGRVRLTAGYQFAGWFNSLTTGAYIGGVQNRQFNNLNETITFDGLVTRLLVQF